LCRSKDAADTVLADDNFATIAASNKDTISNINSVAASLFGK
jgi:hypothetical protein